jgi:hypothetical protein
VRNPTFANAARPSEEAQYAYVGNDEGENPYMVPVPQRHAAWDESNYSVTATRARARTLFNPPTEDTETDTHVQPSAPVYEMVSGPHYDSADVSLGRRPTLRQGAAYELATATHL